MDIWELLKKRAELNRIQYQKKQVDLEENQNLSTITYLGYNATLGMGQFQDAQGNIFYGQPITNGVIGIGETVRWRQGAIARYDALPAMSITKASQTANITPTSLVGFLYYPSLSYYELVLCSVLNGSITIVRKFGIVISAITAQGFFDYDGMAWNANLFIFINTKTIYPSSYQAIFSALVLNTNSKNLSQIPINLNFTSFPLIQNNLGISNFTIAAQNLLGQTNQSQAQGLNISVYKYQATDGSIRYVALYGWKSEGPNVNLFSLYGLNDDAETMGQLEGFSRSNYLYFWDLGTLDDVNSQINQSSISFNNPASIMGFWTIVDQITLPDFHPLTGASATSYAYEGAYFYWDGGYGSVGGIVVNLLFQPTNEAIQIFVPESDLIGASANFIGISEYTNSNNLIFSQKPSTANIATSLTLPNYTQYVFNLTFFNDVNTGAMPEPLDTRNIVYKTLISGQQLAFWTTSDDANREVFT